MNLVETIAWAVVELDAPKPNLAEVKRALALALNQAATLDLQYAERTKNLLRMAKVHGMDDVYPRGDDNV